MSTNVFVRDVDLRSHGRRLEVVVNLPLFGGSQIAVDTTLVSAHFTATCGFDGGSTPEVEDTGSSSWELKSEAGGHPRHERLEFVGTGESDECDRLRPISTSANF